MTVDEMILKALEGGGPITVNDIATEISKRFTGRVRLRLEKLRVRGVVIREGRGGAYRQFTYKLTRPDHAAKALREKGGLARAAKAAPRNTDESELPNADRLIGSRPTPSRAS